MESTPPAPSQTASPTPPRSRRTLSLDIVGLAVAGAAAAFIVSGLGECAVCRGGSGFTNAQVLALVGGLVYIGSLLAISSASRRKWGESTVALSLGAHLVLFKVMFDQQAWCVPCVMAGAGVMIAFVGVVTAGTSSRQASLRMAGAGVLAGFLLLATQPALFADVALEGLNEQHREAVVLVQNEHGQPAPGELLVVVFERPGCVACSFLKRDGQVEEFEDRLNLDVRVVRELAPPSLPTPTVVLAADGSVVGV